MAEVVKERSAVRREEEESTSNQRLVVGCAREVRLEPWCQGLYAWLCAAEWEF